MGERLIIFTHVVHYKVGNSVAAHGPYVNEVNLLASRVHELVVVAPCRSGKGGVSAGNVTYSKTPRIISLPVTGGTSIIDKLGYFWHGPALLFQILKGIMTPGILHPRAPGSVAFMSLLLIACFCQRKRKFAKFAGEWDAPKTLPVTFRWQRNWLAKRWFFNGPVFGYTLKQNSPHIISSFTSNLTEDEILQANSIGRKKELMDKFVLAFAGRLVKNKGVDVLLEALADVSIKAMKWELLIFGDGIEMGSLKRQAEDLGIASQVKWLGWCSKETMMGYLAEAHIVCQPTRFAESWGKVLQEGMAFGCIPVASAIGGLKRQLADKPALLFDPGNAKQCSAIICNIMSGKLNYAELKRWSIAQSQLYSLNSLCQFIWKKYDEFYASK
jgi:glycosyltransferase involved in cell wall biosynthesis